MTFILSPEIIIDQIINGLTIGGIYALIALGYTLVYGILFMINFAHGEIFMFGAFGGYAVLSYSREQRFGRRPSRPFDDRGIRWRHDPLLLSGGGA